MTQATIDKKDTQRLQRAIVDGLEDVKAHDIQVFNTEHLSPLFERVIVASGTSNRQTKALASSVRDAVREAGFPKPRTEGEENGEWIIVDCGAAVAHIMQPAIRTYYHLEEIWGDKPIRLKFGSARPVFATAEEAPAPKKAPAKTSLRRSSAVKTATRAEKVAAEKEAAEKARRPARKVGGKAPARKSAAGPSPAGKTPAGNAVGKSVAGKTRTRVGAKAAAPRPARTTKPAAKAPARKSPAKKPSPRKA
jgi:ribosome-associated protein